MKVGDVYCNRENPSLRCVIMNPKACDGEHVEYAVVDHFLQPCRDSKVFDSQWVRLDGVTHKPKEN